MVSSVNFKLTPQEGGTMQNKQQQKHKNCCQPLWGTLFAATDAAVARFKIEQLVIS
jgi:hypothetical protein